MQYSGSLGAMPEGRHGLAALPAVCSPRSRNTVVTGSDAPHFMPPPVLPHPILCSGPGDGGQPPRITPVPFCRRGQGPSAAICLTAGPLGLVSRGGRGEHMDTKHEENSK